MTRTDFIRDFAESIARREGFYVVRSLAARNNNPGNIRDWGERPKYKGFVAFTTELEGWEALKHQINKNINRGLALATFFAGERDKDGKVIKGGYYGYAPKEDGNDPVAYAAFVADRLGITVKVRLDTCFTEDIA